MIRSPVFLLVLIALSSALVAPAQAVTVSLLWAYDDTYDRPAMGHDLPRITDGSIAPGPLGGLIGEGLTGYGSHWEGVVGDQLQLDLFVSFSNEFGGMRGISVSVGFDTEGFGAFDVVKAREFNFGPGAGCSGDNICDWAKVQGTRLTAITEGVGTIVESQLGSPGSVGPFEAFTLGDPLRTKASNQIATLRLGSIIFELAGSSWHLPMTITPYFDPETDGILTQNGQRVVEGVTFYSATATVPETASGSLLALALVGLRLARRTRE